MRQKKRVPQCKRFIGRIFGTLVLWTMLAGSGIERIQAQVRLVESGPEKLRIEYAATEEGRSRPLRRSWWVGIPPEGEVRLDVVDAQPRGRVETWLGDEREGSRCPQGPACLGTVGWVRGQRVAELIFADTGTGSGDRRAYERVVVDLHLPPSGPAGGRRRGSRWEEDFLRQTLLNYEQARSWRRPRQRRAPKRLAPGADGDLVRVTIRGQGIYRIGGADLEKAGVDLKGIDPAGMRLFYGGGRVLPLLVAQITPMELDEVAIVVEDGEDGRFDREDSLLFYGEPVSRWEYRPDEGRYFFRHNLYTHENAYWLEVGGSAPGKRVVVEEGSRGLAVPERVQSYRERVHAESEEWLLIKADGGVDSGLEWYWEDFQGNARNYSELIRDGVDEPIDIRLAFWGWTTEPHHLAVKWNDEEIEQREFYGYQYRELAFQVPHGPVDGINRLGLVHRDNKLMRFDWYELEYGRRLVAQQEELTFAYPVTEDGAEFRVSGFGEEPPRVFEVSRGLREFRAAYNSGEVVFQDTAGTRPRLYVVAGAARWKTPQRIERDQPAGLRAGNQGADYLIITHRDFWPAAERLAAWREFDDRFGTPLTTRVVDVQDIYDEFAGGLVDPAAIRNFLKHAYDAWNPAPFFVLLLGDGTYDYKNNSGTARGNWVPPYEEGDSAYDEWYVRVVGDDELPDMAIGRVPVETAAEADRLADRLIAYDRDPEIGPWQNRVLLVADDLHHPDPNKYESYFLLDAEDVARRELPEETDLVKLYLAQYPLEGNWKPRARQRFIDLFNAGALILTYLGHGNRDVLAHERMFVVSRDLEEIANGRRLPLMYMAASQVGPFDDPVKISMPEALLRRREGGVIGMIAATRIGFHDSNMDLGHLFHRQMYRSGRSHVPVGQALMEAKQLVEGLQAGPTGRRNVQRFSLFGDPATRLALSRYRVAVEVKDTLQALEEVRVEGQVLDASGELARHFDGQVWVQAFDSAVRAQLDRLPYIQPGSPLFRGVFPVAQGRFSGLFRVPKDITYQGRDGRISCYAWMEDGSTAAGDVDGIVLAGTAAGVAIDEAGPEIVVGFAGQGAFSSGDVVPRQPVLRATIRDASGINVTGEIGHEIELRLEDQVLKVTEFFSCPDGDYREGVVEYALPILEAGEHTLELKAWDSFNNSAKVAAQIRVPEGGDRALSEVLFHPNPLRQEGHFTFHLAQGMDRVEIEVFALTGRLVDRLEAVGTAGFNLVRWQPPEDLANGSYLYRVLARGDEGQQVERRSVVQVLR